MGGTKNGRRGKGRNFRATPHAGGRRRRASRRWRHRTPYYPDPGDALAGVAVATKKHKKRKEGEKERS